MASKTAPLVVTQFPLPKFLESINKLIPPELISEVMTLLQGFQFLWFVPTLVQVSPVIDESTPNAVIVCFSQLLSWISEVICHQSCKFSGVLTDVGHLKKPVWSRLFKSKPLGNSIEALSYNLT